MPFFDKAILWGLRKLKQLHLNRINESELLNPNNYKDLSPFDDADKDGKYSEALEYALNNTKIKNIAISGSFGSGKSSFLRTFEKKHPEWNYLRISLATFKEAENESTGETSAINSQLIEKSILQQIFYKVEKHRIPRSNFKRIQNISTPIIISQAFIFSLWILSVLTIFKPESINKILHFNDLDILNFIGYQDLKIFYSVILLSIFILLSGYFLFILYRQITNMQISKFNLLKGEAEVNKKDDKGSMLNENIDEILYFFEATTYNVVVIEDLDRFKNIDVFIKLREINDLINNSDQTNGHIVFIYAIKDDMFDDDGRSKFFEFMIPIIPYINQSNSYEKLLEIFGNSVEKEFLNDISIYINDMRLLNNISNEFKVYEGKLENLKDKTKLLAMIIYKNLYPSDFSALHKNSGVLATIIVHSKNKYLREAISGLNDEIIRLDSEISKHQNEKEWLKDVSELRLLYIYALFKNFGNTITVDNQQFTLQNISTSDEDFNSLTQASKISDPHSYNYNNSKFVFSNIENIVNPSLTYQQREKLITGEAAKHLQNLKEKIENLQKKKTSISRYSLKELLQIEATTKSFNEDIGNKNILKYFIQYGYINEDFYIYISHFFPGSITKQDHEYWLSVKDQNPLDFEHNLNEVAGLMSKLRNQEFAQSAILNYDLVDFLLKNLQTYHQQTKSIFTRLANGSDLSLTFIDSYFEFTQYKDDFIRMLVKSWSGFWAYIDRDSDFSENKKITYLLSILRIANTDELSNLDKEGILSNYISNMESFISKASEINNDVIKKILQKLDIKFINLVEYDEDPELFEYIYKNNNYQLNEKMISTIIVQKGNMNEEIIASLKTSFFTTVKKQNLQSLEEYITDNISNFVEGTLLRLESNNNESEETVIELLNNSDLKTTLKSKIIHKEDIKIKNISDVHDTVFWNKLISENRISPNWKNILFYFQYSEEELNESLVKYFNDSDNNKELSKNKLIEEKGFSELLDQNLSEAILLSEGIEDNAYGSLVKSVRFWFSDLDVSHLSLSKTDTLISNNKLYLTQENINHLVEQGENKEVILLEKNIDSFIEEQADFQIPVASYAYLIKSDNLLFNNKVDIINNLEPKLLNEKVLLNAIYDLVSNKTFKLPSGLLEELLYFKDETLEDDLSIFSQQIKYLNKDEISLHLNSFSEPYSDIKPSGYKPVHLAKNELNLKLAAELKASDYISSYSETFTKIRINTKHS